MTQLVLDMEDENELLKRKINLLQDLIHNHKIVHGNRAISSITANSRWQNPAQPTFRPRGAFHGGPSQRGFQCTGPRFQPPNQGNTWRKKYSLVNRVSNNTEQINSVATTSSGKTGSNAAITGLPTHPISQGVQKPQLNVNTLPAVILGNQKVPEKSSQYRKVNTFLVSKPPISAVEGNRHTQLKDYSSHVALSTSAQIRSTSPAQRADVKCEQKIVSKKSPLPLNHQKTHWSSQDTQTAIQGTTVKIVSKKNSSFSHHQKLHWSSQDTKTGDQESTVKLVPKNNPPPSHQQKMHWSSQDAQAAIQGSTVKLVPKKNSPSSLHQKMHWSPKDLKPQGSTVKSVTSVTLPHQTRSTFPEASNSALENPQAGTSKERLVTVHKIRNAQKGTTPLVTPAKITRGQKTTYTWVANPAKTNLTGKKISPNAKKLGSAQAQGVRSPAGSVISKGKKQTPQPKTVTPKNKYKWKAEHVGQTPSNSAYLSGDGSTERKAKGPQSTDTQVAHVTGLKAIYRDSTHSNYKVKSRTKIIRRRSNSSSPVDKKSSPLAPLTMKGRYCLRRRISPRVKSPTALKRISPKGLVQLTKHRLRRLPPAKQQDSNSPSVRTSTSSRVIKTRYSIVKKSIISPPRASLSYSFGPFLSWKTRLLMLNRNRQLPTNVKFQQNQQRWKSRGLRCIGGVMYRVSANKLSKTSSPNMSMKQTPRAGRPDITSTSPRTSTPSQYVASRAVQRSLAIIRQAKQKKEKKKEYCMYYSRFGKCNRGESCPYIHDPEKVAVCTRFVRGTCKKTDGSCPFSHKVSKEKMPVCSYFLKGICHNNDCPYSHVYVSKKAEICTEFLKGYCPMGERCKKKHTLLCPDFAKDGRCPKGSKCKLQHHQRKRRLDSHTPSEQVRSTSKQRRSAEESQSVVMDVTLENDCTDVQSISDDEVAGGSGLQKLPSFISLNCSLTPPSDGMQNSSKTKLAEDAGKPIQIKPRLRTAVTTE
ncbi:zinc finger CCCH domain-containing protein 3 [Bombina bombina]|uniref:zinc finger CCCH domain-containing protein 3 n=1 Tax=Bombina bombina TaxID=8345 RepID=UPI00235AE1E9|nr:zinc finger CCCH domain-containing protein 3 [Bombina bombina]